MPVSRRKFFFLTGATAAGTVIGSSALRKLHGNTLMAQAQTANGFGPLQRDPNGIFDLPRGFQYRAFSRTGETMTDGATVPTTHDGMAAFDAGANRTILVRNHELSATDEDELAKSFQANPSIPVYDPGAPGGTATLLVDPDKRLVEHRRSLAGTENNCAGGPISANSRSQQGAWLSCEETIALPASDNPLTKRHGFVFEVPAEINQASDAEPIRDMGRFLHESIAEDPETGFIYETNDDFFELGLYYRFRPNQVGDLRQGGILEALVVDGMEGVDTTNNQEDTISVGQQLPVRWIEIPVPDPEANNQDQGNNNQRKIQHQTLPDGRKVRDVAALFNRTEGSWYDGNGGIVICATDAGPNELGQIWRLDVRNNVLELVAEPRNPEMLQSPDNVTVFPDGQTFLACEDGDGIDRLVGVTRDGRTFVFGQNALNNAEIAGATFSADGRTLFVNVHAGPGVTLAIWGPWDRINNNA